MDIRIYYEDTDCGGVVYYANYLRYFERARTELLRANGIDIGELADRGRLFVVARAEIDYRHPAAYGDIIEVDAMVTGVGRVSFTIDYRVTRKADSILLVTGTTRMASVGKDRRPLAMEKKMVERLKKMID